MRENASSSAGSLSLEKRKEILMRVLGKGCRMVSNHDALIRELPRAPVTPSRDDVLIPPERP
jgi:hypothetical protein